MDHLASTCINFTARGMLDDAPVNRVRDPSPHAVERDNEDDDEAAVDVQDILGETLLARKSGVFVS
jgi:hypothetical protein